MSLQEATAVFFPHGPLTANSLRIAHRRGELAAVDVCGRLYTTPRDVRAMITTRLRNGDDGRSAKGSRPA
jgi:hypothetical protein